MDAQRFQAAKDQMALLLESGVTDLVAAKVTHAVREDGLPQDWVDDLPNLSVPQALELKNQLDGASAPWASALHGLL